MTTVARHSEPHMAAPWCRVPLSGTKPCAGGDIFPLGGTEPRAGGDTVPLGGTEPPAGGDTHTGSRGALQQHLLLFSLAVVSFFLLSLSGQ